MIPRDITENPLVHMETFLPPFVPDPDWLSLQTLPANEKRVILVPPRGVPPGQTTGSAGLLELYFIPYEGVNVGPDLRTIAGSVSGELLQVVRNVAGHDVVLAGNHGWPAGNLFLGWAGIRPAFAIGGLDPSGVRALPRITSWNSIATTITHIEMYWRYGGQ